MRTLPLLALLVASTASTATAAPLQFQHQGTLQDSGGAPLTGSHTLGFSLYTSQNGGSALWTESLPTNLTNGHFNTPLGATTPLDTAWFDGRSLWLGLSVDSGPELSPRLPLVSVPYAVAASRADRADALSGPLSWSSITGVPSDLGTDTLAELGCTTGQIPSFNGSAWICSTPPSGSTGNIDAANIITGTISTDRLPIGTSSGQIAPGDHTHSFGQITGNLDAARLAGTIDRARLPALTAADVGALPLAGGTLTGSLKFGADTGACNSAKAGTLRWNAGNLELCGGTSWEPIVTARTGAQTSPALSCLSLKQSFPGYPSGDYWIDPDGGDASNAVRVYCEMTRRGGGWTRVGNETGNIPVCALNSTAGTADQIRTASADAWFGMPFIESVFQQKELMLVQGSTAYTFTSTDGRWSWEAIATGEVRTRNVNSWGLRGAWNEAALASITGDETGCSGAQGCLLGVYTASGWTMILGIGAHARGAFVQDTQCGTGSAGWKGMYTGSGWGSAGHIYVR